MRVEYLSYTKVAFLTRKYFMVLQILKNKVFEIILFQIYTILTLESSPSAFSGQNFNFNWILMTDYLKVISTLIKAEILN